MHAVNVALETIFIQIKPTGGWLLLNAHLKLNRQVRT